MSIGFQVVVIAHINNPRPIKSLNLNFFKNNARR